MSGPNSIGRGADSTPSRVMAWPQLVVAGMVLWVVIVGFPQPPEAHAQQQQAARVPVLDDGEAWERLPAVEQGSGSPLPVWARNLAYSLPRTTAAMLELDYLHRASSPLAPQLRGMVRWTVADANRCEYTKAYAIADLRRAGVEQHEIDRLIQGGSPPSAMDRDFVEFARQLTVAADAITDEAVAKLVTRYGDKQLVGVVLLVAHANFQDRLFLSLGLKVEPHGPLPPLDVRFSKDPASKTVEVPERKPPAAPSSSSQDSELAQIADSDWHAIDISKLIRNLETQRDRPGRIRVPTWDEVSVLLPERARKNSPLRIKWSLVCLGYQPEMAKGWSACMRSFAEESKQDRVFEESLFWVITRTIHCFY